MTQTCYFNNFFFFGYKKEVKPPKEAVDVGISKWEATLVGQFLDKAPPFMVVKQYVDGLWSQFGPVEIFAIDNGLFFFKKK